MFTGLIQDIGKIKEVRANSTGKEFVIATNLAHDIKVDDSISTNGVCLTATKVTPHSFHAQAIHVTLKKSSLGRLQLNSKVNLELALKASDRLGGHIVQGHVNGTAKLKHIKVLGKNWEYTFETSRDLFKYIINEGSISVDGISLTIAQRTQSTFTVSLIPHTLEKTTLGLKKIGDVVNIEVDIMAKYLENFMNYGKKSTSGWSS